MIFWRPQTQDSVSSGNFSSTMTTIENSFNTITGKGVFTGLSLTTGGGLTLNIAGGSAVFTGGYSAYPGGSISLVNNVTNHIYLTSQYNTSTRLFDTIVITNTTGIDPVDSLKLGQVVTSAGSISSIIGNTNLHMMTVREITNFIDNLAFTTNVTSVDLSVPSGFSKFGGPITTSGVITFSVTATGILKGSAGGLISAVPGVDYALPSASGAITSVLPFTLNQVSNKVGLNNTSPSAILDIVTPISDSISPGFFITTNPGMTGNAITVLSSSGGQSIFSVSNSGNIRPKTNYLTSTGNSGGTLSSNGVFFENGLYVSGGLSSGNSGVTWIVQPISTVTVINTGYITSSTGLVSLVLPTVSAVGNIIRVAGIGSGGWEIQRSSTQIFIHGSVTTSTGVAGSITSTQFNNTVEILCIVANQTWIVLSSVGSIGIS